MNVIFMGTPEIALPTLQALNDFPQCSLQAIYSQPDRPVGRKKQLTASPVKRQAETLGIPVKTPEKVKIPEVLEELSAFAPDLIIVCAYGQILPQALLDIPTIGCFNVHFSSLPRWRGASPVQAAIQHGDPETGVSLQKVVFQLDAGPIVVASPKIPIQPQDTYLTLGTRLSQISATLLTQTLPLLVAQTYPLQAQDEAEVTFCRTIRKEAGRIQWGTETALEIERKLRAFTPWPGIYSFDRNGRRFQITQLKILDNVSQPPGVIQTDFIVGTKAQALQILALKPEGKKEMSAQEFLRGSSQLLGTKLQD